MCVCSFMGGYMPDYFLAGCSAGSYCSQPRKNKQINANCCFYTKKTQQLI